MPWGITTAVVTSALRCRSICRACIDFGGRLRGDLDGSLRPGTAKITDRFKEGVGFGLHSGSNEVNAAARRYYTCLTASTDLMAAYLRESEIISSAAADIATAYGRVDAFSCAKSEDVRDTLGAAALKVDAAIAAANAAQQEAARQAAADEDAILRHRHGGRR